MERHSPNIRLSQKPRHAGHLIRAFVQNREMGPDDAAVLRLEETWTEPADNRKAPEAKKQR